MTGEDAPSGDALVGGPAGTEFSAVALGADRELVAGLKWNDQGLVPVVAAERSTGEVLMLAWMDGEALSRTVQSGRAWYWSRSRQEYWCKGETSGDRQWVREIRVDCDGDALLMLVDQEGRGACHTGQRTCFFRALACPES